MHISYLIFLELRFQSSLPKPSYRVPCEHHGTPAAQQSSQPLHWNKNGAKRQFLFFFFFF